MKQINLNKKVRWINILKPKEKEISYLKEKFNIHPLILDELLSPSDRTRIENYDDYLFLVYHLPIYDLGHRTSRRAEIDFIVTKDALISVSYEDLESVNQFERTLETRLGKEKQTTAELLYYFLEEVNNFSFRQLKHVEKKVNFVGDQLFKRQDRKLLEEISYIKRDVLDFAIIAVPQRSTLESLLEAAPSFWGKESKIYFSDLIGDFLKINYLLENLKSTIESHSETVSQIFEFKTSEVIRRFSILGFLTFPILLYATVALQPHVDRAIIKGVNDYWLQLGVIFVIVLLLAIFFRKKGWF